VKIANVIGKAAKAANFALQIGLSAYEVLGDERAAHRAQIEAERRHAAFVTEIMGHADQIANEARRQLSDIVNPSMHEFLDHVDGLRERILEADAERDASSKELTDIARVANLMLDLSTSPPVVEGAAAGGESR
jgi:hypothetical protein